jgi:hypothetical protein
MNQRIVVLPVAAMLALACVGCSESEKTASGPACTYIGGVQQSFPSGCDSEKPETAQNKREEDQEVREKVEAKNDEATLNKASREGREEAEREAASEAG